MLSTRRHHRGPGPAASPAGRRRVRVGARGWLAAGTAEILLGAPLPAAAHGLGQRYELPVPLGFYLTGAGLAVGLSFLLMAWFMRRGAPPVDRTVELDGPFVDRLLAGPVQRWTLRVAALAVFTLLVAAGLFGAQQPFKNITPIAVWVLWWVGFTYLAAFVGDLWPVVNPWATVYDLVGGGRPPSRPRATYPARWSVAPAVLAFVSFAAMELAWSQSEVPRSLALAMLGYSAFTWIAMAVFGRDAWLARGELFSVHFAVLGRFAPLATRAGNPHSRLVARPFAVGLLVEHPVPPTMTVFVLLMLASVTFDGVIETPLWAAVLHELRDRVAGSPLASWSDDVMAAIAWGVFAALFALLYGGVVRAMAWSAADASSRRGLGGWFVLTLVPIGIAYHLAHYHSLLLVAGQYAIPLLSDPFGWGWDLFGTTLYRVDFSVVDAASIWSLSVGAIVVGHVVAVYLAHVMALRVYGNARTALRSQIPMLVLMVYYTMSSLWILSQPIVKTGGQPG
ncbi:MAG: hypothetical protein ACRELA_23665 [Candidatus Rokuibacteriota bacterium]